jgi:hypothetical protein
MFNPRGYESKEDSENKRLGIVPGMCFMFMGIIILVAWFGIIILVAWFDIIFNWVCNHLARFFK